MKKTTVAVRAWLAGLMLWGLGSPGPARAEATAAHHQFSLHTGLEAALARDELLVPLSHSGLGTRLAFDYQRGHRAGTWNAYVALGFAPLWNRYGHIAATLNHQLRVSHTWALGDGVRWQLGPAVMSHARVNYFYKWDDAHAYWINSQMLGASLRMPSYEAGNYRLQLSMHMAAVGLYQRPPAYRYAKQEAVNSLAYYVGEPYTHPRFAWIGNLQSVEFDCRLWRIGRDWSFGNQSQFLRARDPQAATHVTTFFYASRDWRR